VTKFVSPSRSEEMIVLLRPGIRLVERLSVMANLSVIAVL
jgi:hypothetical protein